MGSFDYTCAISNLPIHAGDKVRYLLLSQNPYEDNAGNRAHSMNDWWFPRTFPLKAVYDDYGSVENVEEGAARDIWMEGLQTDLLTRGWGDNSCHDVPTHKDMSFDALLEAIVEGRLQVSRDTGRTATAELRAMHKTPKGVPTLKRVKAALQKAGQPFFEGWGKEGFLVDNRSYGTVRVRWHSEGVNWRKDTEKLQLAQKTLGRYATVIRAGAGAYANKADLFVHVKPGTEGFYGSLKDKTSPLLVSHMMIREDVWQALLTLPLKDRWSKKKGPTLSNFRKAARKLYEESLAFIAERKAHSEMLLKNSVTEAGRKLATELGNCEGILFRFHLNQDPDDPVSWIVAKDLIPFTVGLGSHWNLFVKKGLPIEQAEAFLDSVAEMAYVNMVLMSVRFIWVPSSIRGAQFGEFDKHAEFLKALAKVADACHAEDQKDQ